jgi:hypothetical protein
MRGQTDQGDVSEDRGGWSGVLSWRIVLLESLW